jgi:hypothetical protein
VEDGTGVIDADVCAELPCTGREFCQQNCKLPGGAGGTSGGAGSGGAFETAGPQIGSDRARRYEERIGCSGRIMTWHYRDVNRSLRRVEVAPGPCSVVLVDPEEGFLETPLSVDHS